MDRKHIIEVLVDIYCERKGIELESLEIREKEGTIDRSTQKKQHLVTLASSGAE